MKKPLPPIAFIVALFLIVSCQSSSANQEYPNVSGATAELPREKTAEEIRQELAMKENKTLQNISNHKAPSGKT